MPLTPIDVQQKTFATALRGYDLDEVDDFLDAVVVALKDYDQRLSDAQERISTLEAEVNDKGDAEGAIARALVAAQRSADAIVADAKEEAQRILADADNESNELAESREAERQRLQAEIDDLRAKAASVRSSVATLAAAIPVTLDEIDDVLDANSDQPSGATFDAAIPVGGYEIAPEQEASSEVDDPEQGDTSAEDTRDEEIDDDADGNGGDAGDWESGSDDEFVGGDTLDGIEEQAGEMPSIEELSERIDNAFDDVVTEAGETADGGQRPWEDG